MAVIIGVLRVFCIRFIQ